MRKLGLLVAMYLFAIVVGCYINPSFDFPSVVNSEKDVNVEIAAEKRSVLLLPHPTKVFISGNTLERIYPKSKKFEITAYTAGFESCGKRKSDPLYGITASGYKVQDWYTIAASRDIPFGTVVYIPYFMDKPNNGMFVVEDRGGAITEGHLDVYMESLEEARAFGRQELEVYIFDTKLDK